MRMTPPCRRRALAGLAALAMLDLAGQAAPAAAQPTGWAACRAAAPPPPGTPPRSALGEATMRPDGTIVLDRLRFEGPGGMVGHAPPMTYRPDNPDYAALLAHLGGLRPGETKLVPPCD
jgi:hypothetical protein